LANFQEHLQKIRIGLALTQPFLATAILRLPFREVPAQEWCPTMATDGYHIFVNPEWVKKLSSDETKGVLAHETLHVVFGHADRRGQRDPTIWNFACDFAINLFLVVQGFKLPSGGCYDDSYRGMSAEEIYEGLIKDAKKRAAAFAAFDISESGDKKPMGQWKPGAASRSTKGAGKSHGPSMDLFDPRDIRVKAYQDSDAPDREQLRQLRRSLVKDMRGKLHGSSAGFFAEEFELSVKTLIPWSLLLRQWLFERVRTDWRSFPFARKHLWRGVYMPSMGVEIPPEIIFAIDTSGSISDKDLQLAGSEVRALRETFPCRLAIIQCDATVQDVALYDMGDPTPVPERMKMKGRGGTDFRPVFEWADKRRESALPIVVYVTDGFGTFPKSVIHYPTIWIVQQEGLPAADFPFGLVVSMKGRS
jgi:predicted metal-dependent peptidase